MSGQLDKSSTTIGQVQWESLESGLSSLEAGHRPDKFGPSEKSGGGTGLVRYPSLEAGGNFLESDGFIRQI
jgi:hypothetical protein